MTQEPKLLTEAEWNDRFDTKSADEIIAELRERGLIAREPVDPLLEEAETLHHAWVAGAIDGRCDAISLALAALRRGMELAERPTLTREMAKEICFDAGYYNEQYLDRLHAALVERLS